MISTGGVIGFLTAFPLLLFLHLRLYGDSPAAVILSRGTWAFLHGNFDYVRHVPSPKPWFSLLLQ